MRYGSGCVIFGLGAASTLAVMAAALEVSVAASPAARGVEPTPVNRTFKGDRSPSLPGDSRVIPGPSVSEPELPEGCIAAADWRSHLFSTEVAGRCVV
jgi:hypothetical protein